MSDRTSPKVVVKQPNHKGKQRARNAEPGPSRSTRSKSQTAEAVMLSSDSEDPIIDAPAESITTSTTASNNQARVDPSPAEVDPSLAESDTSPAGAGPYPVLEELFEAFRASAANTTNEAPPWKIRVDVMSYHFITLVKAGVFAEFGFTMPRDP